MDAMDLEIAMKVAEHMNAELRAIPALKDDVVKQTIVVLLAGELINIAGTIPHEIRIDVMRIVTDSMILHRQEHERKKERKG